MSKPVQEAYTCPWAKEMMSHIGLSPHIGTLISRKFILYLTQISLSAAKAQFAHCPPQSLAPLLELIPSLPLCWLCSQDGVIL